MPQQFWQNACCQPSTWRGSEETCDCNSPIIRTRWGLTMHEAMLRYQLHFGLKPIGPHRSLADELFAAVTRPCPDCDEGLVAGDQMARICPTCRGFRSLPVPGAPELLRVRAEVLTRFPESAAEEPSAASIDKFSEALCGRKVILHNLGNNIMESH